jgi:hypothetical protein
MAERSNKHNNKGVAVNIDAEIMKKNIRLSSARVTRECLCPLKARSFAAA